MKLFKARQDITGQDDYPPRREPYVMTALYARIACPGCGEQVVASSDACGRCGLGLSRPCARCEHTLAAGSRFCIHCSHVNA